MSDEKEDVVSYRLRMLEEGQQKCIEKLDTIIENKNTYREAMGERVTRLEERQSSIQRIVYGAVGTLVMVEVGGIMYVLQRFTEG